MTKFGIGSRAVPLIALLLTSVASSAFAQSVTVSLLSAEQPATLAPVIAAFEALHPDIKVEHESVPFDSMNPTIEARMSAQDPSIDVFYVDSPRVPATANRGYLMNLEDLRPAVEAIATPREVGVLEYQDTLYALPLWNSTQMMFYNKTLLDAAGIAYPGIEATDRLTYDAVLEMAKAAQSAGAEYGFLFEQIDRYYQLQPIYESLGAGPGLTGDDMLTPDITSDLWVQGTEFYASLFNDGIAPRGIPVDQMASVFTSGQVAFYIGGPWQFAAFNAAEGLDYGIAPVPYFAGGTPVTPTDSWAIGISPYTDVPEAARLLAEFMTLNPEGALLTVENLPIPPVNAQAFIPYMERLATQDPEIGPAAQTIITYELDSGVSRPRSIGYVAFEEIMNRMFSDIRNGAEVRPSLDAASQQIESVLSRIQ